jgi:hypothetical protein
MPPGGLLSAMGENVDLRPALKIKGGTRRQEPETGF